MDVKATTAHVQLVEKHESDPVTRGDVNELVRVVNGLSDNVEKLKKDSERQDKYFKHMFKHMNIPSMPTHDVDDTVIDTATGA